MRTMSGGLCLHYDCSNRNSFGYCKTTACINEHYQQEQWGLPSTTARGKWITVKHPLYECSICGAVYQDVGYGFNFCPNCGADMRAEEGE